MNYKFVNINRIFSKLIRDLDKDIREDDVIEWVGEALEFIGAERYYQPAIAFIEVKNHQCILPSMMHDIKQIARNNRWSKAESTLCPKAIIEDTSEDEDPVIPIPLDCNGQPINDYELAYYRPYFDLKWEHSFWYGSNYHKQNYSPVRLSTHSFFESLDQGNMQEDKYSIVQDTSLRLSFKEGSIAIAYDRQLVDDATGYPMIPDNISYTTAITKYITLRIMEKRFYAGREGSKMLVEKAEADWHWYCKQASNVDMMPHGIDEHQNLLDQRSYLLPHNDRYFGYFGNLASPENRIWNNRRTNI